MKKRGLIAIGLAAVLSLSLVAPVSANVNYVDSPDENTIISGDFRTFNAYVMNYKVPESVMIYGKNSLPNIKRTSSEDLPTKYDLRGQELMPLRDQGEYGTCFAHSAMASAEYDAVKKLGVTSGAGLKVDYSEMALAYFMNKECPEDPLGNTKGDKNHCSDGIWTNGNNLVYVVNLLSRWVNPILEEEAPYTDMPEITWSVPEKTDEPMTIVALDPDVKVDSDLAYNNTVAHLQNYRFLNPADREIVKKHIYKGEVVTCSYGEYEHFYNKEHNAYYNNVPKCDNHAVAIVGWDDSFPKEYFTVQPVPDKEGEYDAPAEDGAWLIRNSWWNEKFAEEYPEESHLGYFWMSYYDKSLCELITLEYESADNYDNNYLYDGVFCNDYVVGESVLKIANTFEAKACDNGEILKAASFVTNNSNVDYTIDVYLNPDDDMPESGKKIETATTKGNTIEAGYYTVDLNDDVELAPGEKYSIVVTLEKEGEIVESLMERNWKLDNSKYWYTCEIGIEEGQSFWYIPEYGGWVDMIEMEFAGEKYGNIRIKAFTNNVKDATEPITHTYNVSYELDGGINDEANPTTYKTGDSMELKPATKPGYTFDGWYFDLEDEESDPVTAIADTFRGDKIFYAKWIPNEYKISYELNGGTNNEANPVAYKSGDEVIELKVASRDGYTFDGWYADANFTEKIENIDTSKFSDITVYAKWTRINTPSGGGGGGGGVSGGGGGVSGGGGGTTVKDDKTDSDKGADSASGETKPDTTTETKPDGTKVETKVETSADGATTETVTETAKDGSVVETKTETAADGAKTETIKEVSADGKETTSLEVKTDADGKVTESTVTVEAATTNNKLTVDASAISKMIAQNDGATTENTTVVLTATDANGKEKYTVEVDAKDITPGAKLTVFALDKDGNPVIVDASKNSVKVTKSGDVQIKIADKGDFTVVTAKEAAKIEKAIEKSVKPAENKATVKEGEKITFKLDKGCNKKNIKSITYKSNNDSVKVGKNGKITAKEAGKATISATVTLANGKTKTIKMKIKVK